METALEQFWAIAEDLGEMDAKDKKKSRQKPSLPSGEVVLVQSKEFLELEYEQLNEWARHGEEAAHRIFNFYVSLLTAVLGGLLLIAQALNESLQSLLLIGSIACGLLVLVSVTFLDALVSQYIRNAHYRIGIERIRTHFRDDPKIAISLSDLPRLTLEADAERGFSRAEKWIQSRRAEWMRRLFESGLRLAKLLLPVSTQQIFLSMISSLLLGALLWSLIWGVAGIGFRPGAILVASAIVVVLSFLAQNVFARLGLQDLFDRLRDEAASHDERG